MQKIGFVTTTDFSYNKFLYPLLKGLSKDYDIYVFSPQIEPLNEISNINYVKFYVNRRPNLFSDLSSLLKLMKLISEHEIEYIHSIMPKTGLLASISCLILRKKHIHTFTGQVWANFSGLIRFFYRMIDYLIINRSFHVFCDSHTQKKYLQKEGLDPSKKLEVIWNGSINGINLSQFKPNEHNKKTLKEELNIAKSTKVLLFVGRLNKDKGIETIIKLSTILSDQYIILIVGKNENNYELSKYQNILYVGFKENVTPYYCLADALLLPSKREGFGSVVLEASAFNIPTFCSDIYGLQDSVKHGVNGFKHSIGDYLELNKHILNFFEGNKGLAESFNSRIYIKENFDQLTFLKKFINSYKSITS